MKGKRVLVTGDGDRAMARAAGVVALVGYQTYGEAIERDETTTSPSSSPIWRRLAHLSG